MPHFFIRANPKQSSVLNLMGKMPMTQSCLLGRQGVIAFVFYPIRRYRGDSEKKLYLSKSINVAAAPVASV